MRKHFFCKWIKHGLLPSLILIASMGHAATVTVINNDGAGVGFNDPTVVAPVTGNPQTTLGAQRLFAFQAAANFWGNILKSSVEIRVAATMAALSCSSGSGTLGSAGPNNGFRDFINAPVGGTFYAVALANSLRGSDLDAAGDDITAQFNRNVGTAGCLDSLKWSYAIGGSLAANEIRFYDTVLHEIGHGLGFLTFMDISTGQLAGGFNDIYMTFLRDETQNLAWTAMTNAQRQTSATNNGNLTWFGSRATGSINAAQTITTDQVDQLAGDLTAGTNNGRVRMYAPTILSLGSSVSHWDTAVTPDELMEPFATASSNHVLTLYGFLDMGWQMQGNLTITKTDGIAAINPGSNLTYTIVVTNNSVGDISIVGATVTDNFPATLSNITWTCVGSTGATCSANGTGNINDSVTIPQNGTVTYTVNATLSALATGSLVNTATVTLPTGINETAAGDNSATDTDTINAAAAGVTVTPTTGLTTTENGGTATFTVVLNSQPTGDVVFNLNSSDTTEGTINPATLTFTSANFGTAQTVTVTGVDDAIADGNIGYTIVTGLISSTDLNYEGLNPSDVSVTNTDNDVAGITVNPTSGLSTTEAGGTASFTVVLNTQPTADVTINLSSSDTTEGTVSPASVTFTPANFGTAQTVTVTGVDDLVVDGNIGYTVVTAAATSADGVYNGLNAADVTVTNTDNDIAGITVNPTSGLITTEAGGTASFTVVLNSQPTANVTINLSSSDTTEGTVSPASVTFTTANFGTAQTVTVTGVDDLLDDGDIAYNIVTAAASSADGIYNGLNAADVAVTNTDNDTAGITVNPTSGLSTTEAGGTASFTVVLNTQPTANVTINLSSSDTTEGTVSPASVTFTTANFGTAQTVTVTGVNDALIDGDIAYTIVTAAATSADGSYNGMDAADVAVTNTDNDVAGITVNPTAGLTTTEAGGTASFTVVLNTQPTGDVTINLSSSDTTEGTVSPASVTFTTANFGTAQTVTVTGVDDLLDDGDIAYNIVTAAATSTDGSYSGMNAADVAVTNTDNDTVGITVNPTSGLITTEAGGTASFTVVLDSQPTADVSIAISSADTTEGTVNLASLTFTPANFGTAQTVTVTGVDDLLSDGNIAYSILTAAATSADGSYNGLNAADVAVSNTDNDTAGITVNPTAGLTTTEAGGTATFTVMLNSQPTGDVTINLSSSDTTEGTVNPASVTFTTANFGTAQTVTVTGVDDLVDDGNIAYTLVTAAASSTDGSYNGLNAADVAVTNTDDDVDTDGDGVIDSIEGNADRDGDGIPNSQDYDPTGYFYDEATGQIISGGRIFVACDVGTPQFVNNLNGTNGFYQFVVSNVGTPSTCNITLAIPTGYSLSSSCLSGGTLDVNPGPNPQSLGSNENGNSGVLVNNTCAANPFFLSLRINPGDAEVLNNNIPLTALQAVTPVPTLSQWVLMLLAGLMLVVAGWSLRQVR